MVTIADVRAAINIPEEKELSDVVITSAIDRMELYLGVLRARYSAPSEFFDAVEISYSAFLAYLAYSDRVLFVVPGSFDEGGQWSPIQEEIVRETTAKLRSLREVYEDMLKIIRSYPPRPMGTFHASSSTSPRKFSIGQFDYPNSSDAFSVTYRD